MHQPPVLQPHVVCLGNPVAGNPTQFVLSRAAKECGLDWRFFTSQVATEEFEVAVRGVQALGLQGMVFLDPFQAQAASLLDTLTESAIHLDRVTVARSDGNSWLGDNLFPTALWHTIFAKRPGLLRPETPPAASAASPASGGASSNAAATELSEESSSHSPAESPETNGVLFVGSHGLGKGLESSAPVGAPAITLWTDPPAAAVMPSSATDIGSPTDGSEETPVDDRQADRNYSVLILEKDLSGGMLRMLQQLRWDSSPMLLKLGNAGGREKKRQHETLNTLGFQSVEQVEWMAMEAVANFSFWTGTLPPLDLVRESLEEYMQW